MEETSSNKNVFIIIGVIIVVAVIGYFVYLKTAPQGGLLKNTGPALVVNSQKPGTSVTVDSVTMKAKGFLVVHQDDNGSPGKIIGVSGLLPEGENKNIVINFAQATRDGQTLFVMAHVDGDQNGAFQFPGPDIPANDEAGQMIVARVSIAGELGATVTPAGETASAVSVMYTTDGFSPKTISIKAGQTVTFVNNSDLDMWVASDPHPTHSGLQGFDERASVGASGKYTYTFTKAGTFGYHNHVDTSKKGTVIVQ